MQNSMMIFIFFCFRPETPFLGKFGLKKSKLSVQDKTWYLDWFEYVDLKHPFWANLVQKIKIASLSLNLVPKLI